MDKERILGSLLGLSLGEAMGLPYAGLTPDRGAKLLGPPDRIRQLPGYGLTSHYSDLACMTAQALTASGGHGGAFQADLANRMRWSLFGLPIGMGLAEWQAIMKLWMGESPDKSGGKSADSGPLMRAPLLGAATDELDHLNHLVGLSTRITHSDPRAAQGAQAVALAVWLAARSAKTTPGEYMDLFHREGKAPDLEPLIKKVVSSVEKGESTREFAQAMGWRDGVGSPIFQAAPASIHAWLSHGNDFQQSIMTAIESGGAASTTAALTGAIVGAAVGACGIPRDWLKGLLDWPRGPVWTESLATRLEQALGRQVATRPPERAVGLMIPRHLLLGLIMAGHLARRLAPPW